MFAHLALFQLPLLYLPLVVIGLAVYGSELGETSGRVLVGGILLLLPLDRLLGARVERYATRGGATALLFAGALLAGVAYQPLHVSYWNEDSTPQAALFAALGISSWFASRVGAALVRRRPVADTRGPALALVCLAVAWVPAFLYPLAATLSLGAVLACTAVATVAAGAAPADDAAPARPTDAWTPRYVAFLLGIDLLLVVWDYQWDQTWALHVPLALLAAAIGFGLARRLGRALLLAGGAGFVAAVVHPPFVLSFVHSALAGLALGWVLHELLAFARGGRAGGPPLGRLALSFAFGLVVGVALYQNLALAGWRWVLLIPLLVHLARARAKPAPAIPQAARSAT